MKMNKKIPKGYQGTYAKNSDGSSTLVMVSRNSELCPHCDEEVEISRDIKNGYEVICPKCNCGILLCGECNLNEKGCDWHDNTCRMAKKVGAE